MFLRFLSPGMAYLLALLLVFPVSNIPFASAAEPDRPYKIEIFKKCEQGAMGYRVFVEGTELSQKKPKNIRERALRYFGNFMTWPLQSLLLGNLIYTSEELREKNLFVPLPLSEIQDEINTLKNTKAVASYAPANFLGIDLEKKMDFIAPPILVLYLIAAIMSAVYSGGSSLLIASFLGAFVASSLMVHLIGGRIYAYTEKKSLQSLEYAKSSAVEEFQRALNDFRQKQYIKYKKAADDQVQRQIELEKKLQSLQAKPIEGTLYFKELKLAENDRSEVWLVRVGSPNSSQRVVMKLAKLGPNQNQEQAQARFQRMFEVAKKAQANGKDQLAEVYSADLEHNPPFLILEYVKGITLDELVRRVGQLPRTDVLMIADLIAKELGRLHTLGVVHGDLKLSNIMLTVSPETLNWGIKVLDFENEVSAQTPPLREGSKELDNSLDRSREVQTLGLKIVQTRSLLSPEEKKGEAPSIGSDIWKLGAMVYQLWKGELPEDPVPVSAFTNSEYGSLFAKTLVGKSERAQTMDAVRKIVSKYLSDKVVKTDYSSLGVLALERIADRYEELLKGALASLNEYKNILEPKLLERSQEVIADEVESKTAAAAPTEVESIEFEVASQDENLNSISKNAQLNNEPRSDLKKEETLNE